MNSVNSDYLLSTLLTLKHWSWTTFQYFCNYRGEAVGGERVLAGNDERCCGTWPPDARKRSHPAAGG